MRMRVSGCVGGCVGGKNIKINHIVALPEEFATFWYQFREDRSTNVEVVRGHTDRQTDSAYIYRYIWSTILIIIYHSNS